METMLKLEQIDQGGHILDIVTTVDHTTPTPLMKKIFIKDGDDHIGCLKLDIDIDGTVKNIELEKFK